jgi:hypothetical protein
MRVTIAALVLAGALCACGETPSTPEPTAPALAKVNTAGWAPAQSVEIALGGASPAFNSAFLDGCPFIARDGRTFFMASTRPGGQGGIDIWIATRESADGAWSAPVNAGPTLNTASNDFCPTLARDGHTFYFASNRPGGCGGDDLYVTRLHGDIAKLTQDDVIEPGEAWFETPVNLGCSVNSAGNEASPFPLEQPGAGPVLYFSSTRAGGASAEPAGAATGDADLYMAQWQGGDFLAPALVPGVNTAWEEGQPNVSRDALEVFFYSNRPGTLGGNDIYSATRASALDAFATPFNLGPNVNSAAAETRPSLSWDGRTLYFGSTRPGEGLSDIYVTTR